MNDGRRAWYRRCMRLLAQRDRALVCQTGMSVLLREGDLLFKFCRPQRFPKDYLRRYFCDAQAVRELRGARRLAYAGVRCAEPVAALSFLPPWSEFESVLISGFVDNIGTADAALSALDASSPEHSQISAAIGRDIGRMARSGLLFRDLHLGNALITVDCAPCWIDTDVAAIGERARAVELNRTAISRLVDKGCEALRESGTSHLLAAFESALAAQSGSPGNLGKH